MKPMVLPLCLLLTLGSIPAGADDKPDPKPAEKKPAPKLPLGRDTTFVTGPLDKDGYIDYEAALNIELGKGVTPENNAFVPLVSVFGPAPEGGNGMPPAFYKWLDIPPPPKRGDYFINQHTFFRDRLSLTNEQIEAVYEFQSRSTQRPWEAKDCPPLAEWLKANEKQLAVAIEATRRPEYFHPLVSNHKEGEQGSLIGALLPSVQKCRELASSLTTRATLRMKQGKFDDAWQDIMAVHRLGRLLTRGATLIESLVGVAIGAIASNATLGYLDQAKLTPKQALAHLKELRDLPPGRPMADKLDLAERFMGLESLQMIRRNGLGTLGGLEREPGDLPSGKPTPEELKALESMDWTPALKAMNTWYDRMGAAMRMKDRAARDKEFAKMNEELVKLKKDATGPLNSLRLLLEKGEAGQTVTKAIGDTLILLLLPAVEKVQMAQDRSEQTERNLHVAFALAAYKGDNGKYPSKLADLAPKYLAAVPGDIFSGKELIYRPSEGGYLFYSVGQNGKDENGHWYDDDPPGDDPRVRMPLPEPKKK